MGLSVGRLYRFTFHYGSTYTDDRHTVSACFSDLHSTMVLLIQLFPAVGLFKFLHLHSTMVLLILLNLASSRISSRYLHSTMVLLIQSFAATGYSVHTNLHSTMVLLIRRSKPYLMSIQWRIYIPLWFYLYFYVRPRIIRIIWFTFHYGSTYTFMSDHE